MRIPAWLERLMPHALRMVETPLRDLIGSDVAWVDSHLRVGPIYACFARQRIDAAAAIALQDAARERGIEAAIAALFDGEPVNRSENRPALHTALRSDLGKTADARAAHALAGQAQTQMATLIEALERSDVTDIINVGIGGSDLGSRLALEALRDCDSGRFRVHFLSTVDGHAASHLLGRLNPEHTAAVLVSKSFGTQETLMNGARVRAWLGSNKRLFAVTANAERAMEYGVAPAHVLPMWDWVGGRYSLWSTVGFVVAAALGMPAFERVLAGAAQMDAHVRTAPLEANLAIRHGLVAVWNRNAMGYATQAILPYDERLARLPAYLQQLVMESLGKSVTQDGTPLGCAAAPVIWGGAGGDAQHSFFQCLHQGADTVPMDFIGVARAHHSHVEQHHALLANLLAQAQVFAQGADSDDLQKVHAGNRPSTVLLLDELSPEALGALLALYEHSVYVQAAMWGVNPFDQWGVERGKHLATGLLPALTDPAVPVSDPVTQALIEEIRAQQNVMAPLGNPGVGRTG